MLYNLCTIQIENFDHAAAFLTSIPPALLGHIRSMHISGYKWPPVLNNTLLANVPPPDAIDAYCAAWDELCDTLRSMKGLRDLRLRVNNGQYSKEREDKLIDEVKGIRVSGTIVLQVPPVIDPEDEIEVPRGEQMGGAMTKTWKGVDVAFRLDRRGPGTSDWYWSWDEPVEFMEFYPRGWLSKPKSLKPTPLWRRLLFTPVSTCIYYWRMFRRFVP